MKENLATKIANEIIAMIEGGGLPPWEQAWQASLARPCNAVSKKAYRGINFWLAQLRQQSEGYEDHRWLTFNQAKATGGSVMKGEKGLTIVFWKFPERETEVNVPEPAPDVLIENEKDFLKERPKGPLMKAYHVFNVEQTQGCNLAQLEKPQRPSHDPIKAAELVGDNMEDPPELIHYQHRDHPPRYIPALDRIELPSPDRYNRVESYYNTKFHELGHATGAPKRLARFTLERNQLHDYGLEELVAEMTAALLCNETGIGRETVQRSAAYLQSWCNTIREDPRIIIQAAQKAQKALDLITGATPEQSDTGEDNDKAERETAAQAA